MLFGYRTKIYDIAARNANGQTLIVCWVDVILAKLGQAIIATAGSLCGVVHSYRTQPSTILAQKDNSILRAAAQLPGGHDKRPPENIHSHAYWPAESWSNVAGVLCSDHHSPAAVRLATSLIFGVNVMFPRVAENMRFFNS